MVAARLRSGTINSPKAAVRHQLASKCRRRKAWEKADDQINRHCYVRLGSHNVGAGHAGCAGSPAGWSCNSKSRLAVVPSGQELPASVSPDRRFARHADTYAGVWFGVAAFAVGGRSNVYETTTLNLAGHATEVPLRAPICIALRGSGIESERRPARCEHSAPGCGCCWSQAQKRLPLIGSLLLR